MTMQIPPENFIDKIFKKFSIIRDVTYINLKKIHDKFGPYVTINVKREGILVTIIKIFFNKIKKFSKKIKKI